MKVYTLTLNPAYDVHADCSALAVGKENFVSILRRDAGGKGINISRALQVGRQPYEALVVLGKENDDEFKKQLGLFGVNAVCLETAGRIRENLTIHHDGMETRISFSGFAVDENMLALIAERIAGDEETVLTFTGSLPKGVSKEAAKAFLKELKNRGVRIALDCRSFDLADIQEISPWLVKPNRQEASQWFGDEITSLEEAVKYARKLHDMGVENAFISMDAQGSVLVCDRALKASVPCIVPVSTIGAGDSTIAGFLTAKGKGLSVEQCLSTAVAFGTAACLTEGTNPPSMRDIMGLLPEIEVAEI